MDQLIGLSEARARAILNEQGLSCQCVYLRNAKQRNADTMLVVRAKRCGQCVELVLSPFILEQQ